jgi:plasmid stabilization system protein ParE
MFRVRWKRSALNQLTNFWTQASPAQRQAITSASQKIDQQLGRDPRNAGESRSGGRRILFAPPLVVIFRIEPDGQTVSVLEVRMIRRRGT